MKKENNMRYFFAEKTGMQAHMLLLLLFFGSAYAQEVDREKIEDMRTSQSLMSDAVVSLQKDQFPVAEADYRKAIALNPKSETAKYNLGNAYYDRDLNGEAGQRFSQAAAVADSKEAKHKAFHNLGNSYMNDTKYQEAVDAYKNALRNNPTDDETRYNLALAKKMLEKQKDGGDGEDDDKEQDKEQEDDKEKKENKDKEGDNEDEGDDGEEKEDKDEGEKKEDDKKGDKEEDKGNPEDKKDGDQEKPQQEQPAPGQLSPQQVQNLLEAMNNEEKKVQDKMNAQKQKGAKVKSNKDW
jgi:Ca-activated chloride channel family protein